MSNIKDGGPAFPKVVTEYNQYVECREVTTVGGMSLRDYFAAKALPGVIECCFTDSRQKGESQPAMFARKSYEIADAMLKAREVTP